MRALFQDPRTSSRHVAIIGAGFSGTLTALHLLEAGACKVTLIEEREWLAAGAAYSTEDGSHLLNVRAANMSAFPDAPCHFADWLKEHHGQPSDAFAERRVYRDYLAGLLEPHLSDPRLTVVRESAASVEPDGPGFRVRFRDGDPLACDTLILALGNLHAARLPLPAPIEDDRLIVRPWSCEGRQALRVLAERDEDILLLGTGLTMVDMCLSLDAMGHRGRILATSRRGQAPHVHEVFAPSPLPSPPAPRLGALLRETRERAEAHGWRAAVDALRPHSIQLWQGFSPPERRRFLRHLRPYWDVRRHRIAPQVNRVLETMRRTDRLEIEAGRITGVGTDGPTLDVRLERRGGRGEMHRQVAAIVNCTGPAGIGATSNPLVRSILDSGLARPDALALGLDVDDASRVLGRDGRVRDGLFAVGPLTRGRFWEIVAVPDIRGQVREVAGRISAEVRGGEPLIAVVPHS